MSIEEVLVPAFFLFLGLFVFIFTDRIYKSFLQTQNEYDRLLKGDDVKPRESLLFGKSISVVVGKVISLLMILFSLIVIWENFFSG